MGSFHVRGNVNGQSSAKCHGVTGAWSPPGPISIRQPQNRHEEFFLRVAETFPADDP